MKWYYWLYSDKLPNWVNLPFDTYSECMKAWPYWDQYFRNENPLLLTGLKCVFGPESLYGP